MRLAGRKILVTGAASGIGFAVAQMFRKEGAVVAILDRDKTRLIENVAKIEGAVQFACDVADEDKVRAAVAGAAATLDGIDGVVNCAGIDLVRHFEHMSSEEWCRVVAINLTGPMLVCHAALPALKKAGGGTIVNIASGAALRPLPGRTAYCTTKAALVMFGKTLAVDLAEWGIRVNSICPGPIDTPMFWGQFEADSSRNAELARIFDRYLIKHPGKPDDIANAALYLSSDESSFVTGVALAVDGGRVFH